ncbi:hypothetical protein C84B14_00560 [Salinisphaera sp. C84B14]
MATVSARALIKLKVLVMLSLPRGPALYEPVYPKISIFSVTKTGDDGRRRSAIDVGDSLMAPVL